MDIFNLTRLVFLGFLFVITIATLGLSASLISSYGSAGAVIPVFMALDIAVAIITLVIAVPPFVIDFFRKGALTSMVAIEIGWISLLMILWVAAAGQTSSQLQFLSPSCNFDTVNSFGSVVVDQQANSLCHQAFALEGMTWLAFVGLLAWLVALITLASIAHSRGNPAVWKHSVTGTNFMARNTHEKTVKDQYPPTQPMQQQQQYTGSTIPQYPPQPGSQPSSPVGYPAQYPAGYSPSPPIPQQPTGYSPSPGVAQV